MKILGEALLRDYSGIVCGKGLVVDCTEEEFKETGNKYIRDKNNLFQKNILACFFIMNNTCMDIILVMLMK